ncbi:hypothetical protein ACWKSP_28140 [Micromonosporaceae bacterium Da 78-11]
MIRRRPSVHAVAWLAAGVALLVTLTATPAPAQPLGAAPIPAATVPYRNWNPAPCVTGGLGPLEIDADRNVVIPGQATNCGIPATKYSFTVVAFRPDRDLAFAFSSRLRPYAGTGPTEVRAAFVTPPAAGSTAVCLMRSTTVRIACLAVDVDPQYAITSRPLGTDDPAVSKPVLYQDDALSPEPGSNFCATCVGLG